MDEDKSTPEGGDNPENVEEDKLEVVGESLEVWDMDISFGRKSQ